MSTALFNSSDKSYHLSLRGGIYPAPLLTVVMKDPTTVEANK